MVHRDAEEQFLAQLRGGDPVAYEHLVVLFERPLYRYFYCHRRDHHLAQEQTAETFLELVRALPRMRGSFAQLRSFVFGVARHVQLRELRKRPERRQTLDAARDLTWIEPAAEAEAIRREERNGVLEAIETLEETIRAVLLLRFVEELSLDEIARALALPLGTVKSHLHRGRQQLARRINQPECDR